MEYSEYYVVQCTCDIWYSSLHATTVEPGVTVGVLQYSPYSNACTCTGNPLEYGTVTCHLNHWHLASGNDFRSKVGVYMFSGVVVVVHISSFSELVGDGI